MCISKDAIFSKRMYQQLAAENEGDNLFFSAMSIRSALAMVYAGATGQTKEELEVALFLYPDVHRRIREVVNNLHSREDVEISIANGVWVAEDFAINPDFQRVLQEEYRIEGGVRQDMTLEAVNGFVSEATNGMIPSVLNDLSKETRMVIANAIYFLGKWDIEFNKDKTVDGTFFNFNGSTATVPLMSNSFEDLNYIKADNYSAAFIPYRGKSVGMRIILPDEGQFDAVEALYIDGEIHPPSDCGSRKVNVTMPRFKMECSYELPGTLREMGVKSAFSNSANFDNITLDHESLKVDKVVHKAVVDVSEEGTEAAAATVMMMKRCVSPSPMEFRVDRPFIFEIFDEVTGSPLFAGRVTNLKE